MIAMERARQIGINACIDKLGRDFVQKHRAFSSSGYSTNTEDDGFLFCCCPAYPA